MLLLLSENPALLFLCLGIFCGVYLTIFIKLFRRRNQQMNLSGFDSCFIPALLLIITMGIILSGLISTRTFTNREQQRLASSAHLSLTVTKSVINEQISTVNRATNLIATSPAITSFCAHPSATTLTPANQTLDRYCSTLNVAVTYLLDTTGTVIASSNRDADDSFVGKNYAFRAYYALAMKGLPNGFFALGITSKKRGYYNGVPVKDSSGTTCGIAVIKYGTHHLDSLFTYTPYTFLTDSLETVFLSASSTHILKPLFYRNHRSDSAAPPLMTDYSPENRTAQFGDASYYLFRLPLGLNGWHLTTAIRRSAVNRYYYLGFAITAGFALSVLVLLSLISFVKYTAWVNTVYLSEHRFQTIFEHAPEAIILCELQEGSILSSNAPADKLFGVPLRTKSITRLFTPEHSDEPLSLPLNQTDLNGVFLISKTGTKKSVSVSCTPLQFEGTACLAVFILDITFIYEAQDIINAHERKFHDLTDFLPEGVFETDMYGNVAYANARAFALFGYEPKDLEKRLSLIEMVIPADRSRVEKHFNALLKSHQSAHHEYTALHKDGKELPILVHGTVIIRNDEVSGICGVVLDMTEQHTIKNELQKKDTLEALGIFAGGIAHDFNNLLTTIWSGFSLFKMKYAQDKDLENVAEQTEHSILRGRDLTSQLLTYSKGGAPVKSTMSVVDLVNAAAAFIINDESLTCTVTTDPAVPALEIDTAQIHQALHNILLNAREALPTNGTITISVTNRSGYTNRSHPDIVMGEYVDITISDTGSGIPFELQQRVFDPFFSTKPSGSGLGLASAHSIIKNHGGHLYFESEPDKGTTFHILLPVTSARPGTPPKKKLPVQSAGGGSILIMDDEKTILTITEKLLTVSGYSVMTSMTSDEAIAIYQDHYNSGTPFDCVILDLTIPTGPGGKETCAALAKIDPSVRAIVSSGYANDPVMNDFRAFGFSAAIRKPYNIYQLTATVKAVINSPAGTSQTQG